LKVILEFAQSVHASELSFKADHVVEDGGRYFVLGKQLFPLVQKGFFYAGTYLGKAKDGRFFPSFNLLALLAESGGRSVVLNRKAAWLFICGRDILFAGIAALRGSAKKGDNVLVLNEFGDCLGFGRAVEDLQSKAEAKEIAVKNVSDIGDFLRRER